jgi:hypothetical protein
LTKRLGLFFQSSFGLGTKAASFHFFKAAMPEFALSPSLHLQVTKYDNLNGVAEEGRLNKRGATPQLSTHSLIFILVISLPFLKTPITFAKTFAPRGTMLEGKKPPTLLKG